MFVLRDCTVCFEDYDDLRIPHSISCGHVFCRPCLDALASSAPKCPNCRAAFSRTSIRKVVCAFQDLPPLDASTLSDAELMMGRMGNSSQLSSTVSVPGKTQSRPSSVSPQHLPPKSWADLTPVDLSRWGGRCPVPSSYNPPLSSSTRIRDTFTQKTVTAACDHMAYDYDGLSLTIGEVVELVDGSLEIGDDGGEWVWIKARGMEGTVPRECLTVRHHK